jgi:hypothetical protein
MVNANGFTQQRFPFSDLRTNTKNAEATIEQSLRSWFHEPSIFVPTFIPGREFSTPIKKFPPLVYV